MPPFRLKAAEGLERRESPSGPLTKEGRNKTLSSTECAFLEAFELSAADDVRVETNFLPILGGEEVLTRGASKPSGASSESMKCLHKSGP